ncbi:nicotinate phosphoribosyltransferase [Bisgaard Taxon 10/6]|uniref:nicotinate phosphoribosyltransferase n=1 Tax=Exercitatus varius TaxID=67857 RepID=UPI00294B469C|nr:nicotinate phosphoribosyltransferase [Exercitatus varius]MDG2956429.1 nicotinate phosphoribosyltransferase [Exercitatus varius]MDG2965096.1 nicotinate phosphoribosyltransferase [Exercitatus varius]
MQNSALLMDFYALTMANSYFEQGRQDEIAYFDYFFRKVPDEGGYAVFAGLEQVLDYLENLHFSEREIEFLQQKHIFSAGFLDYLRRFHFRGDVWAVQEGSVVFPNEPLLIVRAPIIDCTLIEAFLLLTLNHQTLIATKAARIVSVAQGRGVLEFGARRAHGADAAHFGARAAYIAGVDGTSNVYSDFTCGIPALGTMAHAYVQSFDSEYEAFLQYAETYPDNTVLLVDTYDTLHQGIPNAIRVHQEYLAPRGYKLKGIRIDSGDLAYLSIRAREMLDAAGLTETKITVSNSLDEYLIKDLLLQGAKIDSFGVGERLITAKSEPVFGGVYKIVALEKDGRLIPKIKLSETLQKTTTPGFKNLWRLYDQNRKAIADVITLHDEIIDNGKPYMLFDPEYTWKTKWVTDFVAEQKLQQWFEQGERRRPAPSLAESRAYCRRELESLWNEVRRLEKPHGYYVDLSQNLWTLKQHLIERHSGKKS